MTRDVHVAIAAVHPAAVDPVRAAPRFDPVARNVDVAAADPLVLAADPGVAAPASRRRARQVGRRPMGSGPAHLGPAAAVVAVVVADMVAIPVAVPIPIVLVGRGYAGESCGAGDEETQEERTELAHCVLPPCTSSSM